MDYKPADDQDPSRPGTAPAQPQYMQMPPFHLNVFGYQALPAPMAAPMAPYSPYQQGVSHNPAQPLAAPPALTPPQPYQQVMPQQHNMVLALQDPLVYQPQYEPVPTLYLPLQMQPPQYQPMQQPMQQPMPHMPPMAQGMLHQAQQMYPVAPMGGAFQLPMQLPLHMKPQRALPHAASFQEQLREALPAPPLALAPTRPEPPLAKPSRRTKRRSKFTKEQDDLIVCLKKDGRLWVEIAEIVGVGSYLAARNRYQVIVGQQGNNNSLSWTAEDREHLQLLLDPAELDKWRYIAQELSRATGKDYTAEECREHARHMFWMNPAAMGVNEGTVMELRKERYATQRLLLQPKEE